VVAFAAVKGWIPYDFDRGKGYDLLPLKNPDVGIIPTICFEDTLGRLTRRFVKRNPGSPQLIMNITNDGWFKESPGAIHHLANAKVRAVELRRPMARCANTGVTCVIDIFGNVDAVPPFGEGFLTTTLKLDPNPPMTIYARFGDWFAKSCMLLTVIILSFRLAPQLLKRRKQNDGD
ncbi:MAG: nitrilase-related carbon-nitrogen hydrolase, partial [Verrucomicrobiota bacterium]